MKREESVKGRGVEKKGEKYTRETGVGEEKRGPRGGEERGEGIREVEDAGEVEEGCKEGGRGLEDWEELGCHSAHRWLVEGAQGRGKMSRDVGWG